MDLTLPRAIRPLRATVPALDRRRIVATEVTEVTAVIAATVPIATDAAVVAVVSADADEMVRAMVRASRAAIVTADRGPIEEIAATVRSTNRATPHRQLSRWWMVKRADGTTRHATPDSFVAPNTAT